MLAFIFAVLVLTHSSDKAVEHSISIASALGVSPLMIDLTLVSLGTDLPKVANSVIASTVGQET